MTSFAVADLYSVRDVARKLGCHYDTVYQMIRRGELGYVRVGRRKMVRPDHLQAYIDAHTYDADELERGAL